MFLKRRAGSELFSCIPSFREFHTLASHLDMLKKVTSLEPQQAFRKQTQKICQNKTHHHVFLFYSAFMSRFLQ